MHAGVVAKRSQVAAARSTACVAGKKEKEKSAHASRAYYDARVHAPEESLLDAIAISIASDGEVGEEELAFAVRLVRDLPIFQGRDASEVEAAIGEAFERFASEGRAARMAALASAAFDAEARIELLTVSAMVMQSDGMHSDEEAFTFELARAIGATEDERARVLSRVRESPT